MKSSPRTHCSPCTYVGCSPENMHVGCSPRGEARMHPLLGGGAPLLADRCSLPGCAAAVASSVCFIVAGTRRSPLLVVALASQSEEEMNRAFMQSRSELAGFSCKAARALRPPHARARRLPHADRAARQGA
ncbi:hypothetical protein Dimus_028463 [Dionaea muscipula]